MAGHTRHYGLCIWCRSAAPETEHCEEATKAKALADAYDAEMREFAKDVIARLTEKEVGALQWARVNAPSLFYK